MSFFNQIGKKITHVSQSAVQKTKNMTEIAKLNSAISDAEKAITDNYTAIGKLYMLRHSDDYEAEFAAMVTAIKDLETKMVEYREQIASIKGIVRCDKCGCELPGNAAFCSSCGAEVIRPEAPAENVIHCKGCGAVIENDVRFCTACGTPVEQVESEEVVEVVQAERVCPNCKQVAEDGCAFCTKCGTKL